MGESPRTKTAEMTTKNGRTSRAALILAATALDATWRTILPGVVGTIVGIMADHALGVTPLLTITGLVLGIALSVSLIYRLFRGIKT
ncbi:MAG: AtpZ/AtpI family protein [Candidatus Microsaccharimonas sossegonensis]|uniref:AtpZ/AtpI family protein n=1 Tax=Candidatus Microsaccharimonas sossegonensis TaxID=2506948 RepID=A0A4Q0AHJ7_9BACT|nr:MAG: AtpZ/AtpI family protein [Candidatus Microsaccharimonas sossegonensis]